ncbi:MAG: FkbM family methyltransferase [Winogradskyella sp.]|uniref:FkbM family methyltransferase n=1 Tax=Winogradskyella sp. TaxID=1883156 RepID=UPI000F3C7423|nr:FkbM family methyltransferase [Winogradskyella sp.]RNC84896.1 MAG: FkbM family methyltransferase [Winogradskyella sp.]
MSFVQKTIHFTSEITRKLPKNKFLRKLYKRINWLFLKLGANPIVTAKMQDGSLLIVDLTTRTEREAFYTGIYDEDLIHTLLNMLRPNTTFLDVGANIGFYSVALSNFISKNTLNSHVVSFEPFEGNFERLEANILKNAFSNVCTINNYGLSDEAKTSQITLREDFKHGSNTGNAAIPTGGFLDEGFKLSEIRLEILDEVWTKDFNALPNIDLVKVDIEGHEDFFLRGSQDTLNSHRPTILMEVNKPYYASRGVDLDETFKGLVPENYQVYRSDNGHWIKTESYKDCKNLDNVFIIPEEKLTLKGYEIFNS